MSPPTPTTGLTQIRLLQSSIPLLTAFTTGLSLAYSTILIPLLLQSPTPLMLRQWLSSFNTGKKLIPSLSILSTSGYFVLAYHFAGAKLSRGYILAGVLSFSAIPYTRVFMWNSVVQLRKKAEEMSSWGVVEGGEGEAKVVREEDHVAVDVVEERNAKALVDFWGVLNLGRAVLLGVSSLVGAGLAL